MSDTISRQAAIDATWFEEKQVEKARNEEAERRAFHPAPYHMQHIKMHASDYRRTCCVCGRRVYQAFTVIGKDGKKKTYCRSCLEWKREEERK